jgi:hypothetical protein
MLHLLWLKIKEKAANIRRLFFLDDSIGFYFFVPCSFPWPWSIWLRISPPGNLDE